MTQLVHEATFDVLSPRGLTYRPRVYAEPGDNVWIGWIEFVAADGSAPLRTGEETSQPSLDAVIYWASGLEPVYFEGALARAKPA